MSSIHNEMRAWRKHLKKCSKTKCKDCEGTGYCIDMPCGECKGIGYRDKP